MEFLESIQTIVSKQEMDAFLMCLSYHVYLENKDIDFFIEILQRSDVCKEKYQQLKNKESIYVQPEAKYCCHVIMSVLSCAKFDEIVQICQNRKGSATHFILHPSSSHEFINIYEKEKKNRTSMRSMTETEEKEIELILNDEQIWKQYEKKFFDTLKKNGIYWIPYENCREVIIAQRDRLYINCIDFLSLSYKQKCDWLYCSLFRLYFVDLCEKMEQNIEPSLDFQTTKMRVRKEKRLDQLKLMIKDLEEEKGKLKVTINKEQRKIEEKENKIRKKIQKEYREKIRSLQKEEKELEELLQCKQKEKEELNKLRNLSSYLDVQNVDIQVLKTQKIVFISNDEKIKQALKEKYENMICISNSSSAIDSILSEDAFVFIHVNQMDQTKYIKIIDYIYERSLHYDFIKENELEDIEKEMAYKIS